MVHILDSNAADDRKYQAACRILGLDVDATPEQRTKRYRDLVKECHPDRHPGNKVLEERFKEVSNAYRYLTDIITLSETDEPEDDIETKINDILDRLEKNDPFSSKNTGKDTSRGSAGKKDSSTGSAGYNSFRNMGINEQVDERFKVNHYDKVELICEGSFLNFKLHKEETVWLKGLGTRPCYRGNVLQAYLFEGEVSLPIYVDVSISVRKPWGFLHGTIAHKGNISTMLSSVKLDLTGDIGFKIIKSDVSQIAANGWQYNSKTRLYMPIGYNRTTRTVDVEASGSRGAINYRKYP